MSVGQGWWQRGAVALVLAVVARILISAEILSSSRTAGPGNAPGGGDAS